MRWKVFFGLSLAFLSGLFLTRSSFAASSSFTYTSADNIAGLTIYDPANNNLGFIPSYYKIEFIPLANKTCSLLQNGIYNMFAMTENIPYLPSSDCSYRSITTMPNAKFSFGRYASFRSDLWQSIIITFYDTDPTESEPCPECPPVPDLPYGEKLDKLTNAVFIVAATMLVLYFFFAIYNMFFKGLK